MNKGYKLSTLEIFILITQLIIVALGYLLFYTAPKTFAHYVEEDGSVEWLTVAGLMLGCIVCFRRFFTLFKRRHWWFLFVTLALGLLLFFASGEEISWGQRIFGIKTPAYFEEHNAQDEMNFHNLVVGGVKLNKLIFSILLSIVLGIYLVLVPLLHNKNQVIRNFLDSSAVPVPRLYQVISFVILFIVTQLLPHEKNAELLECGTGSLLFLIICFPKNKYIFDPRRHR